MHPKIRIFSLADKKNECAAEMEITKHCAFLFTSGPHASGLPPLARFSKKKKIKPREIWRSRRRKLVSFRLISASPSMVSFMTETILSCSLVAAEKLKRRV